LAFIVILFSLSFFQGGSRLVRRLSGSLQIASEENFISKFFTGKLALWQVAGRMVEDYPATGVGLGAYIIELPNYRQSQGKPSPATDSAENYFIQAGSELGLVGFGLVLWVFVMIFKHSFARARMSRKDFSSGDKDPYLSIGIFSGLLALGVNFLFHSYIGSFEVIYTFWFLVALAFIESPRGEMNGAPAAKKTSWTISAAILVTVFGLIHLWNSTHSLSLDQRTRRFGWSQNFGLYGPEWDPERYRFQWTRTSAGLTVEDSGLALVIPMKVTHPDIEQTPVRTRVFLASASFRKKALLREIVFTTRDWVDFEYPLSQPPPNKVFLVFETDRAWQPLRTLGIPDTRMLALALGEVWFRYPSVIPGPTVTLRQTIPASQWAGEFGENLVGNGLSRMSITLDRPDALLRVWLKGQKAMGVGPLVIIRLDGRVIAKTMVLEEEWTPFELPPLVGAGEHVLTIEFTNDFSSAATGQDRNVFLGPVDILSRE
jgi:succinate dehydrogenase hydrophobic anchor subunit